METSNNYINIKPKSAIFRSKGHLGVWLGILSFYLIVAATITKVFAFGNPNTKHDDLIIIVVFTLIIVSPALKTVLRNFSILAFNIPLFELDKTGFKVNKLKSYNWANISYIVFDLRIYEMNPFGNSTEFWQQARVISIYEKKTLTGKTVKKRKISKIDMSDLFMDQKELISKFAEFFDKRKLRVKYIYKQKSQSHS